MCTARVLLIAAGAAWALGCAVHHFDPETGVEHVIGVGHLTMKASVPQEGVRSVLTGIDLVGLAAGRARDGGYVSLGFSRHRSVELTDDAEIVLEWPDGSFESLRVGSEWPRPLEVPARFQCEGRP